MTPIERIITYLAGESFRLPNVEPAAVAISRQTGSGAIAISELLADYLQVHLPENSGPWAIFDKNLMEKVLVEHELPARLAQFLPEDRIPSIRDWIEEALGLHPEYRVVIEQSAETILKLAMLGNVILIGRGANIITGRLPHVLRVRLVGSLEKRVVRIQQRHQLSPEKALSFVQLCDRGRARYVQKYFGKSVGDVQLYDLTLNTDRFSDEEAARLIGESVIALRRSATASFIEA